MTTTLRARLLGLAAALALVTAPAAARAQTAEGTVISNTATGSYTDANANTYSAATSTATVTVGFAPGLVVTAATTVTPASPSPTDSNAYVIQNVGNGRDSVSVSVSAASGLTVTGYKIGAASYASLGALNTALAGLGLAPNATVTVNVMYSVNSGQGGQTLPLSLTATSIRVPATTNSASTNVNPPLASGVTVTPKGANTTALPSNGTNYTQTFTVTNTGNTAGIFNLVGGNTAGTITIVSVNGVAGSSTSASIASGASLPVAVVYSVGNVAAGTTGSVTLTATLQTNGTVTDAGDLTVTVVRPALTISKVAYKDDQVTALTSADRVLPGSFIQFKVTVTNTGTAPASAVRITDIIPTQLTYNTATADAAGWTFTLPGGNLQADLTGTIAPAGSRYIWVRMQVK
jgi:uncharacterized repeat protein (TIGR01451 family)